MQYFIITVDTEGDNLWEYKEGDEIFTKNTAFIPRFQKLCEKYKFKPVYLSNYEMLANPEYVSFAKEVSSTNNAEIGLHLHAWNTPPIFNLDKKYGGNPYLLEYPDDIMLQKFEFVYNLFKQSLGFPPVSHRAGRWGIDTRYFKLLENFNIKVDCSITPHIDWSRAVGQTCKGPNYKSSDSNVHYVGNVLEVPLTVLPSRIPKSSSFKHNIKTLLLGSNLQLRPALFSVKEMQFVIDRISDSRVNYVEFMLHSSELMPNGSPYFRTDEDIELMYQSIESIFEYATKRGFVGITLADYYSIHK